MAKETSLCAPRSQPNDSPKYNPIFERLVLTSAKGSVEPLTGMLAYAEYKLDKCEWIQVNPDPTSEQLVAFISHYNKGVTETT